MQTEPTILSFDRLEISGTLVPKSLGGEADVTLTEQTSSYAILLSSTNSNSTEFLRIELVSTMSMEPNLSNMNHVPWKKRYQLRLNNNDGKYLILHLIDEKQFERWHGVLCEAIAVMIFYKAFVVSSSSHCVSTTRIQSGIHRCEQILVTMLTSSPVSNYSDKQHLILSHPHQILLLFSHTYRSPPTILCWSMPNEC